MPYALIVDDEPDVRELFEMLLERDGYTCGGAANAEEARALLLVYRPDVVVVDIHLPGRNGVDLCWELHNLDPDLPVVVLSAVLEHWSREDILDCGASAVLDKAQPVREIVRAIEAEVAADRASRTVKT